MKAPRVTITIAIATIVVALSPALQQTLVLDRHAIAHGQLWRIATGNLVHFSASHLLWDLLVVTIAGARLEARGWPVAATTLASAVAIGVAVVRYEPSLGQYGGLSGVACTLVVIAAVDSLEASGLTRAAALVVLALLAAKLWWEWRSGSFVFVNGSDVVAVPLAHLTGSCVGVAVWLSQRFAVAHRRRAMLNAP